MKTKDELYILHNFSGRALNQAEQFQMLSQYDEMNCIHVQIRKTLNTLNMLASVIYRYIQFHANKLHLNLFGSIHRFSCQLSLSYSLTGPMFQFHQLYSRYHRISILSSQDNYFLVLHFGVIKFNSTNSRRVGKKYIIFVD